MARGHTRQAEAATAPDPGSITPAGAEAIARRAHRGQKDRAGRAYMRHIERVAAAVAGEDDETQVAAWLHDVVEDTAATFEDLRAAGCGTTVMRALRLLTRDREKQTYTSYIERIARSRNEVAQRVKLADLRDHLEVTPEALTDGLRRRYELALSRLAQQERLTT